MMGILAIERFDVKRDTSVLREGLEELAEQLCIHRPDLLRGKRDAPYQVGAARYVEGGARERFVHWQISVGVTRDAALLAESLRHRLTERDAAILDSVMLVDMKIAFRRQRNIDPGMSGELLEHMIEKSDPGGDGKYAGAVKINLDGYLSFLCLPLDPCFAQNSILSVCSGSRILTRLLAGPYPTLLQ